ncbi:recombinase family protein [Defluviimonas sp. SAOS-178_SWC]|uniref:recombinase family protein n=1 Tax=Defluviimonas sp. SAOS-178_SWC TaxID=3121287 RepID=UPI003221B6F7
MVRIRCAIYTRKSSDEGLEQEFNSLDAQREACGAYIASQRHEDWELVRERYDDGGISGSHLDRPALQRMMRDLDEGRVDQIVVYKIDRLTRPLADFAWLVDRLDAAKASFVSVTQSFNTATSMGRLTLNVLLSFAQFEREVTAERIRDKIAASKKKGLWMGDYVPLGYDAAGRTLTINAAEAETVRTLFTLYETHRALHLVEKEAKQLGLRSKRYVTQSGRDQGGQEMSRGHIHKILATPLYIGKIGHKGVIHQGQHPALIGKEQWDRVQGLMQAQSGIPRGQKISGRPSAALTGKLFDAEGKRLTPVHTQKRGRRYDYYISQQLKTAPVPSDRTSGWRLPARDLEVRVGEAVRRHLRVAAMRSLLWSADAKMIADVATKLVDEDLDMLTMLDRVVLETGALAITLARASVAEGLGVARDCVNEEDLHGNAPFTIRRRGVETRLLLQGQSLPRDETLIANIARAQAFLGEVTGGRGFQEIAEAYGLSVKRVQQVLEFAFLSPTTVRQLIEGRQPSFLTTDWCLKNEIPVAWSAQDLLFHRA